jgi:hypothetical protein
MLAESLFSRIEVSGGREATIHLTDEAAYGFAERSHNRAGKPIAVTVCGEATEVWLDASTGELILGWTDRDKSDVLVTNTVDFTVQELVDSAESVYDCCG